MSASSRGDGLPESGSPAPAGARARTAQGAVDRIECNACPVLCLISDGRSGACDRYANRGGVLVRVDPVLLLRTTLNCEAAHVVPFAPRPAGAIAGSAGQEATVLAPAPAHERAVPGGPVAGDAYTGDTVFVSGVGASTTYPDYKPAPFIVSSQVAGVDMVTVVSEGIFSYCSFKVKIDTDRYIGPEQADVLSDGEKVGHVTTAEYGSQMLSLGGVHHLTGGSKKEGRATLEVMHALGNRRVVQVQVEGGAHLALRAGDPPLVDGVVEQRMRVGCGSAAIGMFAQQLADCVDEAVVVDDHITGVLTEHQAGRCLGMRRSGLSIRGRKSTPGRYFRVARPGSGWGGTDLDDPLAIVAGFDAQFAWPGLRLLMTSTTGEHAAWFELDDALRPIEKEMPAPVRRVVERIGENCEPALASVLFLAGAGGSLRAGVTENPVQLTRSIAASLVEVTCGGAPVYVWPGGGITLMVDVLRMPEQSFGTVPTPALVAPIEFGMRLEDYRRLGGYMDYVRPLADVIRHGAWHGDGAPTALRWGQRLSLPGRTHRPGPGR